MADDDTPPVADDEIDLEELIGNVLETRGFTADRATKLDLLDSLGQSFSDKVDELFSKLPVGTPTTSSSGGHSSPDFDAFFNRIGAMVDEKLAGLSPGGSAPPAEKKRPLLQRMLGLS